MVCTPFKFSVDFQPVSTVLVLGHPLGAEVKADDHREDGQKLASADGLPQSQHRKDHRQGEGHEAFHRQQIAQPFLDVFHVFLLSLFPDREFPDLGHNDFQVPVTAKGFIRLVHFVKRFPVRQADAAV